MKVSRKSWHYRLYNYLHNLWRHPLDTIDPDFGGFMRGPYTYYPDTLCKYFWACVLMVVGMPFLLVIGLAGGVCLVVVLAVFAVLWPFKKAWESGRVQDWNANRRLQKQAEEGTKEPGIIKSYIKAKKGKYCPTIILVD